jgi:hypothetical protein
MCPRFISFDYFLAVEMIRGVSLIVDTGNDVRSRFLKHRLYGMCLLKLIINRYLRFRNFGCRKSYPFVIT